jgi:hypothetical protein
MEGRKEEGKTEDRGGVVWGGREEREGRGRDKKGREGTGREEPLGNNILR